MPRKATVPATPVPPGPTSLELRVNGKIVFLQRCHTYNIDQGDEQVTISAVLKLPVQPAPRKVAPMAALRLEADGEITPAKESL